MADNFSTPLQAVSSPYDPSASGPDPIISFDVPVTRPDMATWLSLAFFFVLLVGAVMIGQSQASFFDLPSVIIVILGTFVLACASFSPSDLSAFWTDLNSALFPRYVPASNIAINLVRLSALARKRGFLALSNHEFQYARYPFLARGLRLLVDGYSREDIDAILTLEQGTDDRRRAVSARILARGAEIAPAMGLIGTLIGLVQMLSVLDDPSKIGPAMALALLTTFYGAVLGNAVLTPLSHKVEKSADHDKLLQDLVRTAIDGMHRQDNPRKIELALNALLPERDRIRTFD